MTNITTIDYDNITEYDKILNNCTDNENNVDIIIPTILLTIPCGLSILCLMRLMVYTLNKPLFKNKLLRIFHNQIIQFDVS